MLYFLESSLIRVKQQMHGRKPRKAKKPFSYEKSYPAPRGTVAIKSPMCVRRGHPVALYGAVTVRYYTSQPKQKLENGHR